MKNQTIYPDRRSYIRLDVVFPVEFQFLNPDTGKSISEIKQGFTRNIGKGGICLEVKNVEENFERILSEEGAKLGLRLHIPLSYGETKAVAKVEWYKKITLGYPNEYLIGISFQEIAPKDKWKIYFHAICRALTPKLVSILMLSLVLGLTYFYLKDWTLRRENEELVQQLVQFSSRKVELKQDISGFDIEYKELKKKLLRNQNQIRQYETKTKKLEQLSLELKKKDELLGRFQAARREIKKMLKDALLEKARLYKMVSKLSEDAGYLKAKISKISEDRTATKDALEELLSSFEVVEERGIESMYRWLKNHQNKVTGLVVSYEGDKDLEDWAFTYDQSLSSQCFILMGERSNAQRIFDFYKTRAERINGVFVNAYDAYTGKILEYDLHTGPNIWLGIATLQYINKFKDIEYLPVAEGIGEWLVRLQNEDEEFGIRGGPEFRWFSTEHNLDAYAFFGMLYNITREEKYLNAQERTFKWLKKNAFSRKEGRLKRGKGDATIATDTFAWAIAAIGPELLYKEGMDPDQIMGFAETNCQVTTSYTRPDGREVKITGFDFGKYEHLARGGVVSTEWTAQMVVTLKIMAEYHTQKGNSITADYYKRKADFYLSELEKMVIASPSKVGQGEGCLPYASQDNVDTGHGWRVAQGSGTGSTAGTAYTIFAKYNYNALLLR